MSLSSGAPKFHIAICGAGIGGLFLAVTIGKFADRDVQIDLYEAHDAITPTGAGVSIWPRTMEIMKELGISEEVSHVSTKPPSSGYGPRFRKSDIPEGGFEWFHHIFESCGPSSMHRQHLVDILKRHLPTSCTVHFNKRLTKYDKLSSGSCILHFADDSTETADVLIGADGVRSSVRKTLFDTIDPGVIDLSQARHYMDASWSGTLIYRATFPVEKLSKIDPNHILLKGFVVFCGKGKHIASYPVSQGTLINVLSYVSDKQRAGTPFEGQLVSDVPPEELDEAFQDFEPSAKSLLKCCENTTRWALHVVNELPLSTWDRVALIGDACHAMTPHLGAGVGQAMEDAFVLGRLLAHPLTTLDNVHAALKAYQDVRLPASHFVVRKSEDMGYMYEFDAPGYYDGTDRGNEQEELELLKEKIIDSWCWGESGAIAEWLEAEKKLQESVELI